MLLGRCALLSPLALETAEGDLGECWAYVSSFWADACGVAVSMFIGIFGAAEGRVFSVGDGLSFVSEGGTSEVGDRGPPHWLMNESTAAKY